MKISEKITAEITRRESEIQQLHGLLSRITNDIDTNQDAFITVGWDAVEVNFCDRKTSLALMTQLGAGKWDKEAGNGGDTLNYTTREPVLGQKKIRLWAAQPPGTCRIVEEEIDVPETVVPAHKEIKKRVVCIEESQPEPPPIPAPEPLNECPGCVAEEV